jgi:uncharacterized membrane protein
VVGLRVAAVVLCALPWVAALHIAPGWFEHVVELTFLPLCHHWPARVLSFDGVPMCVCSRCAGLSDRAYARILVVGLVVTVLDVITQDAGFHAPCHPVRLATGAWLGWTAASWMLATSSRRSRPEPLPG